MALILVLGAVTVLTVMLTEFQDDTSAELATALADRDALKAEYLAKSGIELSRLVLSSEDTVKQAIQMSPFGLFLRSIPQIPVWDYSDMILGAFNDQDGKDSFQRLTGTDLSQGKNLGIEGGSFSVKIIDEDSKLNVNVASRADAFSERRLSAQLLSLMTGDQYTPMFEARDQDGQFSDRAAICSAIIDWADPDETLWPCDLRTDGPTAGGAEDNYYQLLKKPYWRKNAAYDSLDELHLVRGVTDDFWATFVDPDPTSPAKRVMTVWGQGKTNINSANAQTIWALICANVDRNTPPKLCFDPTAMASFLTMLTMVKSMLPVPLFQKPEQFVSALQSASNAAQAGPGAAQASNPFDIAGTFLKILFTEPVKLMTGGEDSLKKALTTKSDVFSIYSDGIVPGYQRRTRVRIHAVVDRRGAPPPGQYAYTQALVSGQLAAMGGPAAGSTAAPAGTATAGGAAGAGGAQNSQWATAPDPGGTIIYYQKE